MCSRLRDSKVNMELNSSKLRTLYEDFPRGIGSLSFIHMRVRGESPRATVQVSVARSPCCKLDGAVKGTTLGATVINIEVKSVTDKG